MIKNLKNLQLSSSRAAQSAVWRSVNVRFIGKNNIAYPIKPCLSSVRKAWLFIFFILAFFKFSQAQAQEYNLFNKTPDHKLRQLNTERSTKSDFATTVDAGRVQIETSVFSATKDKNCNGNNCTKISQKNFGDTNNIRLGISENSELQLFSNLHIQRKIVQNKIEKQSGFGDLALRFKHSFSGNKNEKFGFATTVFVKLPDSKYNLTTNDIRAGIAAPFSFAINDDWSLGGMSQINLVRNNFDNKSSYFAAYLNAVYVSRKISDKIYFFTEYATYRTKNNLRNLWQNSLDFALHYYLTSNFKIDIGTNIGVTKEAEDLNYYSGFAYRF